MAEKAVVCVVGADNRVNNTARTTGGHVDMAELQDEVTMRLICLVLSVNFRSVNFSRAVPLLFPED